MAAALAVATIGVIGGCAAVDGTPTSDPQAVADVSASIAESAGASTETEASTTSPPMASPPTTSPPMTAMPPAPPQNGAATDPDQMTCATYVALTPEQQQATITTFAQRHNKQLVLANRNSYLLVLAFCKGVPGGMLKDNLMLQGG